jgi:hypothetical protein
LTRAFVAGNPRFLFANGRKSVVDQQGGLVRFTRLRRGYLGEGAFDLVEEGDLWLPERSYSLEARTHQQSAAAALSPSAELAYSVVTLLSNGTEFEALETVAAVLTNQEAALETTRPVFEATPEP